MEISNYLYDMIHTQKALVYLDMSKQFKGTDYEQFLIDNAMRELNCQIKEDVQKQPEERLYTATDLEKVLNVHKSVIGKIANAYDLRCSQYGEWRMFNEKNRYTPCFWYNDKGVEALKCALKKGYKQVYNKK